MTIVDQMIHEPFDSERRDAIFYLLGYRAAHSRQHDTSGAEWEFNKA